MKRQFTRSAARILFTVALVVTADSLDYERMSKVVVAVFEAMKGG